MCRTRVATASVCVLLALGFVSAELHLRCAGCAPSSSSRIRFRPTERRPLTLSHAPEPDMSCVRLPVRSISADRISGRANLRGPIEQNRGRARAGDACASDQPDAKRPIITEGRIQGGLRCGGARSVRGRNGFVGSTELCWCNATHSRDMPIQRSTHHAPDAADVGSAAYLEPADA